MKIAISEVVFDGSIYPRDKPSTTVIEEYADALLAGETFPAIILEKGTNRLLDGYHRWKAHSRLVSQPELNGDRAQFETIEAEQHTVPEGIPVKLYAAKLSARHGHRLKAGEIKALAREICEADPDFASEVIGAYVGRSRQSVDEYVRDIKGRRKEQQRSVILRLSLLGWTDREIAGVVGADSHTTVTAIRSKMPELAKSTKTILDSGVTLDVNPGLQIGEYAPRGRRRHLTQRHTCPSCTIGSTPDKRVSNLRAPCGDTPSSWATSAVRMARPACNHVASSAARSLTASSSGYSGAAPIVIAAKQPTQSPLLRA